MSATTFAGTTWMERAACAGIPGFTELDSPQQRTTCVGCPVRAECLEFGLNSDQAVIGTSTVYGGLSGFELAAVARERRGLAKLSWGLPKSKRSSDALEKHRAGVMEEMRQQMAEATE